MYKINNECYKFKEIKYENGIFDNIIDCTYILHLEGNGRLQNIYSQLNKINPSKKVFILFNKGFKKCKKNNKIDVTYNDLIEANYRIFLHAKEYNFNNILILEDDFIFDEDIKKEVHIKNISNFINKKKDKSFLYSIGCIPIISIPLYYDKYTLYSPFFISMQSCIFSKKYRENILDIGLDTIYDKDKGWDININSSGYIYYIPLCYQTFEETENRSTWDNMITNKIIKKFNMDVNPEYGFKILNKISKIIFWLLLLIVTVISYFILKDQPVK
jgi:hypothetical protein